MTRARKSASHSAVLENTDVVLTNTHGEGQCYGEHCTIHNRSDHHMRSWPQEWRSDRRIMERICPHGVGHPDPDEYLPPDPDGWSRGVHGCDGCCVDPTVECFACDSLYDSRTYDRCPECGFDNRGSTSR